MNGLKRRDLTPKFLNILLRPSPKLGSNRISSLWPRTTASVTSSAVARLPRACHTPLTGNGCALRTVELRRVTRRCRTPPGTASLDAVPQMQACRSHLASRPATHQQTLVRRSASRWTQVNAPRNADGTNTVVSSFCRVPYFFGMVIKVGLSHKCHSRELCGDIGRLIRSHW